MVDDMLRDGKLLSCFVAERKHRMTKRAALFVFRHIDNTVSYDLLNRQCEDMSNPNTRMFRRTYMVGGKRVQVNDMTIWRSKDVVLACGSLRTNDVLWLADGSVGKVVAFWTKPDEEAIAAQMWLYSRIAQTHHWDTSSQVALVVDTDTILDAVIWAALSPTTIRVIPPAMATLLGLA